MDKLNVEAKQDAFIESLKNVPVLSHLSDDDRRDVVFTIAGAYTGGKAILEAMPSPVMSPAEIRVVHEVVMQQTATIADLVYQKYVPEAYKPELSNEERAGYGHALADVTESIMEFATELAKTIDEEKGGTSQIVLPS